MPYPRTHRSASPGSGIKLAVLEYSKKLKCAITLRPFTVESHMNIPRDRRSALGIQSLAGKLSPHVFSPQISVAHCVFHLVDQERNSQ